MARSSSKIGEGERRRSISSRETAMRHGRGRFKPFVALPFSKREKSAGPLKFHASRLRFHAGCHAGFNTRGAG
jgi:hypothetical protein